MPDLQRKDQGMGAHPALVLVDMVRGFTDPACPLGAEVEDVVEANRKLLAEFRELGLPVFFTTVVYQDENQARVFRARLPALNLLTPGSIWVEIDPRLAPRPGEVVVEKRWASGFFRTQLDEFLQAKGVDSLVITGLTTSGCVRATAVDALQHEYKVVVVKEAVGDRNESAHKANLNDLNAKYADVMGLQDLLDLLI